MTKYKPKRMETLISQIERSLTEWTPGSTREEFIKMYDENFNKEVKKKNHKKNPKEWHKNVKRFTKYSQ